jgi:hypothetical protein
MTSSNEEDESSGAGGFLRVLSPEVMTGNELSEEVPDDALI